MTWQGTGQSTWQDFHAGCGSAWRSHRGICRGGAGAKTEQQGITVLSIRDVAMCHELSTNLQLINRFVSSTCPFRATAKKVLNRHHIENFGRKRDEKLSSQENVEGEIVNCT